MLLPIAFTPTVAEGPLYTVPLVERVPNASKFHLATPVLTNKETVVEPAALFASPGLVTVMSVVPAPTTVNTFPAIVATAVFDEV